MLLSIGIDLDNTIIDYHNLFQTTLEQKTKTKLNRIFSKSISRKLQKGIMERISGPIFKQKFMAKKLKKPN